MKKWLFSLLLLVSVFGYSQNQSIYTRSDRYVAFNLLDTFGTGNQYAFSFFLLRTAYTGDCILVRRSNDNATQRIGFSGGYLDTTALKSFVGSNSGFVVRWYNQSPNRSDSFVTKSNATQPRVVNSGVIERENGVVGLRFLGGQVMFLEDSAFMQNKANLYFYTVAQAPTAAIGNDQRVLASLFNSNGLVAISHTINNNNIPANAASVSRRTSGGSSFGINFNSRTALPFILTTSNRYSSGLFTLFYNNSPFISSTMPSSGNTENTTYRAISLGATDRLDPTNSTRQTLVGFVFETGIWDIDQLNNNSRINQNINRRYRLY